jgi:hypothetical protein
LSKLISLIDVQPPSLAFVAEAQGYGQFCRDGAGRQNTLNKQALTRDAQADGVAGVAAFLLSDAARWITAVSPGADGE